MFEPTHARWTWARDAPSFFVFSGKCARQCYSYRTDQTDASSWIFDNAGAKADELHIV